MNLLHSLKEKKEAKKKPYAAEHFHVHYYPIPYTLSEPPVKAPKKHELEEIHDEHLTSLGWTAHEYKYIPEPKIRIPSKLIDLWHESAPWDHSILDADLSETFHHHEDEGIYVEVPFNPKIIIEHPHASKKVKSGLLAAVFHKLTGSKNHVNR
ncbi:uncharacterized protein LOC143368701 isoform X2 [Andrena cerasifolii]